MKSNIFGTSLCSLLLVTVLSRFTLATPIAEAEAVNLDKRACTYPVALGLAKPYAMLATTSISDTGTPLSITGNIGVCPAGAITGITPAQVTGTIEINTPAACAAKAAASSACACADAFTPVTSESYSDITGKTFTSGAYSFSAPGVTLAALGTVTFSGPGQFYMHIGTTLTTGANSLVALTGGATACNIFWLIGSSPTLGASTKFNGTICATTSITLGAGVTSKGLMFAQGAAITVAGGTFQSC